jgi:sodium/proline symporter
MIFSVSSVGGYSASFIVYFAVLMGIAVVRSRQMQGMADYVLGGRQVGSLVSALSSSSSASSAWTMLVFPALAFVSGIVHLWTARRFNFWGR